MEERISKLLDTLLHQVATEKLHIHHRDCDFYIHSPGFIIRVTRDLHQTKNNQYTMTMISDNKSTTLNNVLPIDTVKKYAQRFISIYENQVSNAKPSASRATMNELCTILDTMRQRQLAQMHAEYMARKK